MKRWILFFLIFIAILAVSFWSFLYIKRVSFIESALQQKTSLQCSIKDVEIGFRQTRLQGLSCSLPDSSSLTISQLDIDLSLFKVIFWLLNPFEQSMETGKWKGLDIALHVHATSPNFSQNGWKEWIDQVSMTKSTVGCLRIHNIDLKKVQVTIKNESLGSALLEVPPFTAKVVFAREDISLQATLAETVTNLLEEVSLTLGISTLISDEKTTPTKTETPPPKPT